MPVCIHCPASVIISIGPVLFYFYPHSPALKLDDLEDKMKIHLFSFKQQKFGYQRKTESWIAESWFIPDSKYYVAGFEQLMTFLKKSI